MELPKTSQEMTVFEWSRGRLEAAQLIAYGELSQDEIAARLQITRRTLYEWRQEPDFAARVDEVVGEIKAVLNRLAISHVERRVDRLNRDWLKLQAVISARAASPEMVGVPGGDTGLLVRTVKGVGSGDNFRLVCLYRVDVALLHELREIEKQAAQELGQWVTKTDLASTGGPLVIQYVNDWRAHTADDRAAIAS